MAVQGGFKSAAQERKASRVVASVYALSRKVAADMGGDPVEQARANVETFVWMLTGLGGDQMRDDAWEKLYQESGINASSTGVNPSVEVRAMVLARIEQDRQIEDAVRQVVQ